MSFYPDKTKKKKDSCITFKTLTNRWPQSLLPLSQMEFCLYNFNFESSLTNLLWNGLSYQREEQIHKQETQVETERDGVYFGGEDQLKVSLRADSILMRKKQQNS